MNIRKKALILATLSATILLYGCNKKNNNITSNTDIINEYTKTIEKEFDIGEHTISKMYKGDPYLVDTLYQKIKKALYLQKNDISNPELLEIFNDLYIQDGYYISNVGLVDGRKENGLVIVFVNNKPICASGVLGKDGDYHFSEFGNIIEEKSLVKKDNYD